MITWEGKPKDQKLPSGHLLKGIIRSWELDLVLLSQTLYPLHIRLWPLQWSSSLCPFIYLNRGRASSTGMKGKPKDHLCPCQGLTFCLPVIYHTLPLRPDQRGRLTVTSAHALPASPAPPHPTRPWPIWEASWEGLVNTKIKRSCMGTNAGSWLLCPFNISFVSILERIFYGLSSR